MDGHSERNDIALVTPSIDFVCGHEILVLYQADHFKLLVNSSA